jgi:hypothetical protein
MFNNGICPWCDSDKLDSRLNITIICTNCGWFRCEVQNFPISGKAGYVNGFSLDSKLKLYSDEDFAKLRKLKAFM